MREREGAKHHTDQPEQAQPQSRYRVDHYGKSRNFAAYEGQTIIAVTLYRKGAAEIMARLEEKDCRIAALESQLAALSESQIFPSGACQKYSYSWRYGIIWAECYKTLTKENPYD